MSMQSSVVLQEIQETLGGFFTGISLSSWSLLERSYWVNFRKSLRYKPLGVRSLNELLEKMGNMVVVFEERNSKMKYVMSAPIVETRRQVYLKDEVQELFTRHGGEIMFDSFEDFYKKHFASEFHYDFYALTGLDNLCEVLKDILVVELDPSGAKVIKLLRRYNLRKRKRWM